MRIWIVNHYALPVAAAGGTRHYSFARQLIKRGHEVVLIAANYSHNSLDYISSTSKPGEVDYTHDVPFVFLPVPKYKGNTLSRFWNMLVFSQRIRAKKYLGKLPAPDIIVGSSPHLFAAWGAQHLARRLKIPFVLEVRDIWPETLVDLGRFTNKHPLIRVMKYIERQLYQRAQKIITLLPASKPYLMVSGVKEEDICCLPNLIDTDVISKEAKTLTQDKFTVMYAGAHGVANDLRTIVQAAQRLEDQGFRESIRICLIGEGPEKSKLQAEATHLNLKMIEFLDAVPKAQIYKVLDQAHAFIMLLKKSPVFRWGISPNKLFDYLFMAKPVIFGVETPYNPVEVHQAGITIKPGDPKALAEAIKALALMPKDTLAEMGQRGKNYVLENHHVERLTDTFESLLVNLTHQKLQNSFIPGK